MTHFFRCDGCSSEDEAGTITGGFPGAWRVDFLLRNGKTCQVDHYCPRCQGDGTYERRRAERRDELGADPVPLPRGALAVGDPGAGGDGGQSGAGGGGDARDNDTAKRVGTPADANEGRTTGGDRDRDGVGETRRRPARRRAARGTDDRARRGGRRRQKEPDDPAPESGDDQGSLF